MAVDGFSVENCRKQIITLLRRSLNRQIPRFDSSTLFERVNLHSSVDHVRTFHISIFVYLGIC